MQMNDGIFVQEAQSCLLCGTEGILTYQDLRDRLFGAPGTWALMRCPKCHLIWLNPRPVPPDIGKLYKDYFTHETADSVPRLASFKRVIRDAILACHLGYNGLAGSALQRGLGKTLSWVRPIKERVELSVMALDGPPRGKLLDVGCGNGQFLAKMQELGWDVVGVEPDVQAVRVARARFGLRVYQGTLEEVGFPGDMFNAITMSHVIEHVWDPIGLLKECRRLLRTDGRLVLVTPNSESLGRRLFGTDWRGWEPPRHLFLYSTQTLRMCTESVGLCINELRTTARGARGMWLASRLLQRDGQLPRGDLRQRSWRLQLGALLFWFVENLMVNARPWGEEIVMIAGKAE